MRVNAECVVNVEGFIISSGLRRTCNQLVYYYCFYTTAHFVSVCLMNVVENTVSERYTVVYTL